MKTKLAAACLLLGLAQAPHASATVGTVTYFGVVANTQPLGGASYPAPNYDNADLFGGGNLEGDLLTAAFTYNTYYGFETLGATSDEQRGGVSFSTPSPITSATFTVTNPVTLLDYSYTFTPDYSADVSTSTTALSAEGYDLAGDDLVTAIAPATKGPVNLSLSFFGFGAGTGNYFDPAETNTGTLDSIAFDTYAVSVSAAPEPTSWAMMVAAIGVIGASLRLRRRTGLPNPAR